jgi:ankyrin repeat protein
MKLSDKRNDIMQTGLTTSANTLPHQKSSAFTLLSASIAAGEGKSTATYSHPAAPQIGLLGLPAEVLAYLMAALTDPISVLNLSATCQRSQEIYHSNYQYPCKIQLRQYHALMHSLDTPSVGQILESKLVTTIPEPDTAEWKTLRDRPLSIELTGQNRHAALIKKLYIKTWDLLLQPQVFNNQQIAELMRLLLDLLPHISNAQEYARKLFFSESSDDSFDNDSFEDSSFEMDSPGNTSPENSSFENNPLENDAFEDDSLEKLLFKRFEPWADIHLERCLQLVTRHFSVNYGSPAYNFIVAQCPSIATLKCLEEIQSGHCDSFLFYIVDKLPLLDSHTPMHDALIDLLNRLVDKGGDFAQINQYGETLLIRLLNLGLKKSEYKKEQIQALMKRLLQQEAACNAIDKEGNSLLIKVCSYNLKEVIPFLLNQINIDVNIRNNEGNSALHYAVKSGNLSISQALLNHLQIDINVKNNKGKSALHIAVAQGNLAMVKILLQRTHIDVNARNNQGESALEVAVQAGDLLMVNVLLQQPGIDINTRNSQDKNALAIAVERKDLSIVQALLDYPTIDIEAKNSKGITVLAYTIQQGDVPIVQSLLTHPTLTLATRLLSFHYSISLGREEITNLFLQTITGPEKTAFVNQALALAVQKEKWGIAEILCEEYGADSNINNAFNISNLDK